MTSAFRIAWGKPTSLLSIDLSKEEEGGFVVGVLGATLETMQTKIQIFTLPSVSQATREHLQCNLCAVMHACHSLVCHSQASTWQATHENSLSTLESCVAGCLHLA